MSAGAPTDRRFLAPCSPAYEQGPLCAAAPASPGLRNRAGGQRRSMRPRLAPNSMPSPSSARTPALLVPAARARPAACGACPPASHGHRTRRHSGSNRDFSGRAFHPSLSQGRIRDHCCRHTEAPDRRGASTPCRPPWLPGVARSDHVGRGPSRRDRTHPDQASVAAPVRPWTRPQPERPPLAQPQPQTGRYRGPSSVLAVPGPPDARCGYAVRHADTRPPSDGPSEAVQPRPPQLAAPTTPRAGAGRRPVEASGSVQGRGRPVAAAALTAGARVRFWEHYDSLGVRARPNPVGDAVHSTRQAPHPTRAI